MENTIQHLKTLKGVQKMTVTRDVKEFILASLNITRELERTFFSYPNTKQWVEIIDEPPLTKKDIESEGFIDTTKEFQKPNLMIGETTESTSEQYYKAIYSFKDQILNLEDCEGLIFTGTIQNKSDFNRILQMTGINH